MTPTAVGAVMTFVLTAYCAGPCCGTGTGLTKTQIPPVQGFTVACDPRVLPMGSLVRIRGLRGIGRDGEHMCQDVGGAIKGRHIDVYMRSHEEARRFGRRKAEVQVLHVGGQP